MRHELFNVKMQFRVRLIIFYAFPYSKQSIYVVLSWFDKFCLDKQSQQHVKNTINSNDIYFKKSQQICNAVMSGSLGNPERNKS